MEEIKGGFRIEHDGQTVEATFDQEQYRLTLKIDGKEVCLHMGETGYFLAHMAGWYELGGD